MSNSPLKYRAIRALIMAGEITEFTDIFEFVSTSRFSKDTGISVQRLKALKAQPFDMLFNEAMKMVEVIDVDITHIGKLTKNTQWAAMN